MSRIHIVSHTHWDREWYKPFQYFRVKLVYMLDRLLEVLENEADFKFFLLDGQTIVLEDYLQVRPEKRERLKEAVSSGRLIIGPWYIQPDEFAPDAESLIRNLQIGLEMAAEFGEPMRVGYLPDSFGHTAQLPQILKGFGIDSAVVMRGVDAEKLKTSEFIWQGINGDEVLGLFLPKGYSNAMFLPEGYAAAKLRLNRLAGKLKKRAASENLLVLNGVDHQFPQAFVPGLIKRLNAAGTKDLYLHSSLENYIADVRAANPPLPQVRGELLTPVKQRVHSSMASTRIYQKQQNRKMEALLEKYVEPVASIGWMLKTAYPAGLLRQAWKVLIQNQTHDGICGCCTDEVHREMDQRFVDVKNISETLLKTTSRAIARQVPGKGLCLLVFNNSMTRGRQLVSASLYIKNENFSLRDSQGNPVPFQVEKVEEVDLSKSSIWNLYLGIPELTQKIDICFTTDFEFNAGFKRINVLTRKTDPLPENSLTCGADWLENRFCRVEIHQNGSFNLLDKTSGFLYEGLHIFEDMADAGDTYNYSPPAQDEVITSENSQAEIELVEQGPLKVTFRIRLALDVPARLAAGDKQRSAERVVMPITTHLSLYSDLRRLDLITEVDNKAEDHRLRVLFPAGFRSDYSWAETQFGTLKRRTLPEQRDWQKNKWSEKPLPIYSQQRFVDINDGEKGLALLNKGLPEFEIYNRESSVIALTLFRGVGMMGKSNLLVRPGRPSGISTPTPDAQCLGRHSFEYALFPHSGDVDVGQVPQAAADFDAPPLAVQNRLKMPRLDKVGLLTSRLFSLETLTSHVSGQMSALEKGDYALFKIDHKNLLVSSVKKAEREEALVVRLYNASGQPVSGARIFTGFKTRQVSLTDFNESENGVLEPGNDGSYLLPDVKPWSAITIKFTTGGV